MKSTVFSFGYGSLIWKADFPFVDRRQGFIRGYRRRFWQGSHDHRGTADSPGRVLTLIPELEYLQKFRHLDEIAYNVDGECVWGMVYRIADDQVDEVTAHLDFREKNGYAIDYVKVYAPPVLASTAVDTDGFEVLDSVAVYIANHDNEAFLGPAPSMHSLASHILRSQGPSGLNSQYFFELYNFMEASFPVGALDCHLTELKSALQRLMDSALADHDQLDFYKVLELDMMAVGDITSVEVKKAYHRLSLVHHPDKNDANGGRRFQQINEAYSTLIDPERRNLYDIELRKSRIIRQSNDAAVMVDRRVSLEDFDEHSSGEYRLLCRCGGCFSLTVTDEARLLNHDINDLLLPCTNCSLVVSVVRSNDDSAVCF